MMNLTIKLNLMMIVMCCMPQVIQTSSNLFDQDGRTELMNYVIAKEAEIKIKKIDLDKLWDKCFYKEKTLCSYVYVQGQLITTYRYTVVRKMYTTDADVAEYRMHEEAFNLFVDDIIENIRIIVFNGADLKVFDNRGKSVRDYCYTQKISDVLYKLGAPSTFGEKTCGVVITGFLGVATITISYMVLTACYNACFSK